MNYLFVALGGSLGALARYQTGLWLKSQYDGDFPLATLLVNVLGSFIFGLAFYFIVEKSLLADGFRLFVLVGMLGAFTTYSTFSFELLSLIQKGHFAHAIMSVLANVLLSLLAVSLAYYGSKQFF